ncbi:hypothetical protein [Segatella hominis]|uniref:hypothetical protein n=1 Tax=Segatella hominis TaxID=2518605 RepID=UPI0021C73798|nr:hypothetical protein [Segatella hominis]
MELTIKEKGQEGESCTKHNKQISIVKGIGIILVVVGHSGCPEYLHTFIYSCLLSTSDAADEARSVEHCGPRITLKKKR